MAVERIRISKVAGRYLVFDPDHVARLRRNHNVCSLPVGTVPQNPTQNIFLSLPLEIPGEEARALVDEGVAYLADEPLEHLRALQSPSRKLAYVESLKRQRLAAERVSVIDRAKKTAESERRRRTGSSRKSATPDIEGDGTALFEGRYDVGAARKILAPSSFAVTPNTSRELVTLEVGNNSPLEPPSSGPLYNLLHGAGYYMTPGLRFGASYSVYPGDPLRYHAHFLANQYDWDQEVDILDLVASGRLATAVKKGFLVGGEKPKASNGSCENSARAFSIEWAGM
jgi:tRNA-splicing endonuclease subunit Sen34